MIRGKFASALSLLGACLLCLSLVGCGGGSSSSSVTVTSTVANQVPLTVDSGPSGSGLKDFNTPFASVTICAPGTSNCQTIDHVMVDIHSSGLRILASVLNSGLLSALPAVTDTNGQSYSECAMFGDGNTWGPVQSADVKMAGEVASDIPIQVISGTPPSACSDTGPMEDSVQTLRANGVLGIGPFIQDCGADCVSSASGSWYYTCTGGNCTAAAMPLATQVSNPVSAFPQDNEGTLITLSTAVTDGQSSPANGTLTFGIDTQTDNSSIGVTVLTLDGNGEFTSTVNGVSYPNSYLDSGETAVRMGSNLYPACTNAALTGYYCPSQPIKISGYLQGSNGLSFHYIFIANDGIAAHTSYPVQPGLTGPSSTGGVVWGLPFFYGATVYTAIEGKTTSSGDGPWTAIH
jgi:hypothetical protein